MPFDTSLLEEEYGGFDPSLLEPDESSDDLRAEQQRARRTGLLARAGELGASFLQGAEPLLQGPAAVMETLEKGIEGVAHATGLAAPESRLLWRPSETMRKPIFGANIPQIETGPETPAVGQAGAGVANAVIEFANFLQTPEFVAFLGIGALPKAMQQAAMAGIAGQMASTAPEQFNEGLDAAKRGDIAGAAKAVTSALGSTAFSALAGRGALPAKVPKIGPIDMERPSSVMATLSDLAEATGEPLPPERLALPPANRFIQREGLPPIDVEALPVSEFAGPEITGPLADVLRAEAQREIVPYRTGKPAPEGVPEIGGYRLAPPPLEIPGFELPESSIITPIERGAVQAPGTVTRGKVSFGAEAPTLAPQPLPERTISAIAREKQIESELANTISEAENLQREGQLSETRLRQLQLRIEDQVQSALREKQATPGLFEAVEPGGWTPIDELFARARFLDEGLARPVELLKPFRGTVQPLESQTRGRVSFAAEAPTLASQPLPERTLAQAEVERAAEQARSLGLTQAAAEAERAPEAKPAPPEPVVEAPAPMPELISGDRLMTLVRPDGTTETVSFGGKYWDFPGRGQVAAIAKNVQGKWSHGMLAPGEKLIELERTPNAPEIGIKSESRVGERPGAGQVGLQAEAGGGDRPGQGARERQQAGAQEVPVADVGPQKGVDPYAQEVQGRQAPLTPEPSAPPQAAPSPQALGILPGLGPVGRAIGQTVRDIFIGARRAVAPRGKRGGIVEPYSTPMIERLDQLGGPVSRTVANEARQIDSRAVSLAGQLAPVVDKARSLASRAFRGGTTWIRGVEPVNDTAAISRLHLLEGPDRATVVATAPPKAQPMVGALWDANFAVGQLAQQGAPGFVPTGKIQRILTNRGIDVLREGDGLLWERWADGTAQANGKTPAGARAFFRNWKAELDKPAPDTARLDKISQDFHRDFPKAVTHVKLGPAWVEMLVSDPVDYLNASTERTSRAVAFRSVYPATPQGSQLLAATREAVMKELPTNRHKSEFDNLIRVIQGHPLDLGIEQAVSASSTPARVAAAETLGAVTRPLKSAMLSLSSLANAAETVVGGPAIFLRFRSIMPLLAKDPRRFYGQLEMAGMVNLATRNLAFNPTKPLASVSRMISEGIGRVTMSNFFNEVQEYTGSGAARIVADRVRSGAMTPGEVKDFTSVVRAMGLRDRAKAIAEGRDAEGLEIFEREAAPFLSMGHDRPSVRSRWGNSRAFNSLFWFHRYPQMVLNQFRGIANNLIEDVRKGDASAGLTDAKLMARFVGLKAVQGALGTLLVTLVKEGASGVQEQAEEARKSLVSFLAAATAQAVGGPLTIAQRLGARVRKAEDIPEEVAKTSAPLSAAMDAINALSGKGGYQGEELENRLDRWITSKSPALRAAKNALNKAAVMNTPGFPEGQVRRLMNKWMEKNEYPKIRADWERRQGQDFGVSDYKALRSALRDNDLVTARREYEALLKIKKGSLIDEEMRPATEGVPKPFGPSHDIERKFRHSLTPEQEALYKRAIAERRELWQRFLKVRAGIRSEQ